jgi:hypothetical protein
MKTKTRTWIVTVEVTFAVEAPSYDDAIDKAHDHITWQGLNDDTIESVGAEEWTEGDN